MDESAPLYRTPEISPETSVDLVDRWLIRAVEALLTDWDEDAGNFWRDSLRGESDASDHDKGGPKGLGLGKGATSNNRAFQAMVGAAYFLSENNDVPKSSMFQAKCSEVVRAMIDKYFCRDLLDLRSHGENQQNAYTDSQLLLSLCLALSPVTAASCRVRLTKETTRALTRNLTALARDFVKQVTAEGVKVHPKAVPHHFLTLHAARALDAAARTLERSNSKLATDLRKPLKDSVLTDRVKTETIQQLGLHLMPSPGFDSSSLLSCCALTTRFTGDAESPIIHQAVEALVSEQSERGTWSNTGVLSFGRRRLVYIPSVELSLVMVNLSMFDLCSNGVEVFSRCLPALDASFRLVQSSFVRAGNDSRGWRNDRTLSAYEVESWTTAVVLQFLLAYREVLVMGRQEKILRKYRAKRPAVDFTEFWPDLERLIPAPSRARRLIDGKVEAADLADFTDTTDPTPNNGLVEGIRKEILEPTMTSLCERPVDTASFMLYGPPGTRKTSLVSKAADALKWPLVTLSPPAFLKAGIEGFEATADEVFEDLLHLRRVVVLFDECEEFFRWRPNPVSVETRTIGAFITSGMLPRLQRLRETRWIVFVINSNTEAFELDDAVTRRGRLDKAARVGHPVYEAQMRYLTIWRSPISGSELSTQQLEWFAKHLGDVDRRMRPIRAKLEAQILELQRRHPNRGDKYREEIRVLDEQGALELKEVVTFSILDSLALRCLGEGGHTPIRSSANLKANLDQEFGRFGPDRFGPLNERPDA